MAEHYKFLFTQRKKKNCISGKEFGIKNMYFLFKRIYTSFLFFFLENNFRFGNIGIYIFFFLLSLLLFFFSCSYNNNKKI